MTVNTQELRELVEKARWYAVDRYDLATQCSDRDDAHREAESCAAMWPKSAPYRAMQLIDAAAMLALLDEIDALRAELQARQWVSVDDDWPEEGDLVLAVDKHRDIEIVFGSLIHETFPDGTYSHWMPLPPAPPQGETE